MQFPILLYILSRIGIVNRVVPLEGLMPATYELAHRIAAQPFEAIRAFKRSVYQGMNMTLGAHLDMVSSHLALLRVSAAPVALARFGAAAFAPPPGHLGSPELGLWAAYAAWLAAVLVLYPASAWFLRKKEANPGGALRFF